MLVLGTIYFIFSSQETRKVDEIIAFQSFPLGFELKPPAKERNV